MFIQTQLDEGINTDRNIQHSAGHRHTSSLILFPPQIDQRGEWRYVSGKIDTTQYRCPQKYPIHAACSLVQELVLDVLQCPQTLSNYWYSVSITQRYACIPLFLAHCGSSNWSKTKLYLSNQPWTHVLPVPSHTHTMHTHALWIPH